jgi:hypothetical protein
MIVEVDRLDEDFVIDAALIGKLLGLPPSDVSALMRSKAITGTCEIGIDADQGTFRLSLFHRGRRARIRVDATGNVLQRSVVDFGEGPRCQRRG